MSELAAAGMPSILVPFIAKTTSHQVGNALFMQEAGGAFYVPQKECTAEKLYDILSGLDRLTLIKMGDCAKAIARPDAAVVASEEIEALSR